MTPGKMDAIFTTLRDKFSTLCDDKLGIELLWGLPLPSLLLWAEIPQNEPANPPDEPMEGVEEGDNKRGKKELTNDDETVR